MGEKPAGGVGEGEISRSIMTTSLMLDSNHLTTSPAPQPIPCKSIGWSFTIPENTVPLLHSFILGDLYPSSPHLALDMVPFIIHVCLSAPESPILLAVLLFYRD
uniref:Uncharacterized protein n=1 Tax=Astyanax mexicanus TaxID=7994 RepID=A0A3B1IY41_ASTMX